MFVMRFDVRGPDFGAAHSDLYAATLEMAAFAETHGFAAVVVSEHHATDDGYLPSPLPSQRRSPVGPPRSRSASPRCWSRCTTRSASRRTSPCSTT